MSPGAIVYFRVLAGFFAEIPPDAGEENKISDLTQRERERKRERDADKPTDRPPCSGIQLFIRVARVGMHQFN
jgi:hypothetical protein